MHNTYIFAALIIFSSSTYGMQQTKSSYNNEEIQAECPICLLSLYNNSGDLVVLNCTQNAYHTFHSECMNSYFKVKKKDTTCPLDRINVRYDKNKTRIYSAVSHKKIDKQKKNWFFKKLKKTGRAFNDFVESLPDMTDVWQ